MRKASIYEDAAQCVLDRLQQVFPVIWICFFVGSKLLRLRKRSVEMIDRLSQAIFVAPVVLVMDPVPKVDFSRKLSDELLFRGWR